MGFSINKSYRFFTLAPSILGGEHTNMKVLAIMTADQAVQQQDIVTQHNALSAIIPMLPKSVSDCTFILFKTANGDRVLYANEYIDQSTITETATTNIRIELLDAELLDLAVIRTRLLELGFTNAIITTF